MNLRTFRFRIISFFALSLMLALAAPPARAASPQLVSARHPSIAAPSGGNGGSVAPYITPDGRFVLFTSAANNLVPGQDNLFRSDVFLRDRLSNTTVLVSVNLAGNGGGNGHSVGDMVSTNGRYVLFESDATNLVFGDSNKISDVFLRDLQTGTTALVSVATNGASGNAWSLSPVMTPDGRYVVFLSAASDLIPNDTNGLEDVFVRNNISGTTTLVSVGATAFSASQGPFVMDTPSITPDGRYVTFFSFAQGLVSNTISVPADIYLRDMTAATTTWISSNQYHYLNGTGAIYPSVSDNGRFVTFEFQGPPSFSSFQIFRYDASTQSNALITASGFEPISNNPAAFGAYKVPLPDFNSYAPKMTPDGRFVAYINSDTNIHVWDSLTLNDAVVSVDLLGNPTTGQSDTPAITPDGHFIAFMSTATNLVTNTVTGTHLYVRDMLAAKTSLVDLDSNGAPFSNIDDSPLLMTSDGRFVAFDATGASQPGRNRDDLWDVFMRDLTNSSTELISAPNPTLVSLSGNNLSLISPASLSTNGRWFVFASVAEDLVTNDFNGQQDVLVSDLLMGTNTLVSVGTNGLGGLGGASGNPLISGDGRYVVFTSGATNLVPNDTNGRANIFRRDLQTGTTILVNVDPNGAELGPGDSSAPAISRDGRFVAFLCKTNLSVGNASFVTFWRDLNSSVSVYLTNNSSSGPPSLSADGRFVAYNISPTAGQLCVWDSHLGSNIYAGPGFVGALSPDGSKLLYNTTAQIAVADLATGSILFNLSSNINIMAAVRTPAVWSADGRFFTFSTVLSNSPSDKNNANDVFLADLSSGAITLISANSNFTASANGASDWPSITSDGRFIVFRSFATDIVPGVTNPPNIFVFDRLTGTNTLLTAESSPPLDWSAATRVPSISADGSTVAFQSLKAVLSPASLDLNRTSDVFAQVQSPWPVTDSVGDGIPDAWRALYFGGSGTTTNSQSCAACDPDGDGMSNLQEYLTGTSPINSASVLALQISANISANNVVLNWPAVPGTGFKIQYKNHLTDSWLDAPGTPWVVGRMGYFNTPFSPGGVYYRLIAN